MTDSDIQTETWKPIPGFAIRYQASTAGRIRNKNGLVMRASPNGSGYLKLNLTPDEGGDPRTPMVHQLVLWAFRGECPPGMEACHLNHNKLDNRLVNLEWGGIPENRSAPSPARPVRQEKPKAPCILCGAPVTKGGRRCHDCIVKLGVEGTEMARDDAPLDAINDRLKYGNAAYLHTLMVKYGGWGHCRGGCTCEPKAAPMPADLASPAVTVTLRERLMRRFGKRAGDGQ